MKHQIRTTTPRLFILLLALFAATGAGDAQTPSPYSIAAGKVPFAIFEPVRLPEGFKLSSMQVASEPSMVISEYTHSDGRMLVIMQTTPDGAECPTCEIIDVNGKPSRHSRMTGEDGTTVIDLTVLMDKTAVILGMRSRGTVETLPVLASLKSVAESLTPVAPSTTSSSGKLIGLKEAAKQASFPVYSPTWLPQYFFLKSASYTPASPAVDQLPAIPEEVAITYSANAKDMIILLQPESSFAKLSSPSAVKRTVKGHQGLMWREQDNIFIAVKLKGTTAMVTGNLQESSLLKVAESLEVVK